MTDDMLWLPLAIILPLFAAIATCLARQWWCARLSIGFAILQVVLIVVLIGVLPELSGTERRYALGGWGAPLGIDLVIDGLSAIMLLTTAVLVLVLTVYSTFYFANTPKKAMRFWPLWWLLITGLNSAFLAADAFNIYVALELIGLSSVALIAIAGNRDALVAALRYALVGLLGSLFYLLGVALLYRTYGTLDLVQLASMVEANPMSWSALSLISAGLLLKTALFPLHFWLPSAHSSAPAPVSAVLSALVVKASFYLLIRYWLDILAPAVTDVGLQLMGLLGGLAIIWGCVAAFKAQRLKLLVAYSTVAQLGYLFLLLPLTAIDDSSEIALQAIAFFVIAHALAKSALFLVAGNIIQTYGHDDIHRLGGIARSQPLNIFTFAIAGASLIGLPPNGGFIAKWLSLNAAVASGQWWWVVVILCGGLLTAMYIFKVLNIAFTAEDKCEEEHANKETEGHGMQSPLATETAKSDSHHPAATVMALCGFVLAIMLILLCFNTEWILDVLANKASILAMESTWKP